MSIQINYPFTSGGGGSQSWQQTLIVGSVLGQNNTIDGNGFDFLFTSANIVFASGTTEFSGNSLRLSNDGVSWLIGSYNASGSFISSTSDFMASTYYDGSGSNVGTIGFKFDFGNYEFSFGSIDAGYTTFIVTDNVSNRSITTQYNAVYNGVYFDYINNRLYYGDKYTGSGSISTGITMLYDTNHTTNTMYIKTANTLNDFIYIQTNRVEFDELSAGNGRITFNGTGYVSATAGGSSGSHLNVWINVGGVLTQRKIALLLP